MILTVTPNPLLERRLFFENISFGKINRAFSENFYAGGKGINVSRQLNQLGIKNLALTFLGGHNGKLLRKALEYESINFNAVSTKDETRYATVTINKQNNALTSFFSQNSDFNENEVDEFINKMDKAIQNCSIVVFAGSAPNKLSQKVFTEGISLANKYDKISILDTYGEHLKECIELSPFAIHNNRKEIEDSLGINISNEENILDWLDALYKKSIKMAFVTDGEKEVYSSKFDFHFKASPPKVNSINSLGSGDAFVAGIVYGLERSLVYEDFLKLAIALGSFNTQQLEAANVKMSEAETLLDIIEVQPVGKKMKLIDDSPNY
ncbi:MAG TPA: 1-phosphofructokinase [Ignavibacteria bacterium]|nr:1-phosphofructokinase [Ignavibacteria bacterium]